MELVTISYTCSITKGSFRPPPTTPAALDSLGGMETRSWEPIVTRLRLQMSWGTGAIVPI